MANDETQADFDEAEDAVQALKEHEDVASVVQDIHKFASENKKAYRDQVDAAEALHLKKNKQDKPSSEAALDHAATVLAAHDHGRRDAIAKVTKGIADAVLPAEEKAVKADVKAEVKAAGPAGQIPIVNADNAPGVVANVATPPTQAPIMQGGAASSATAPQVNGAPSPSDTSVQAAAAPQAGTPVSAPPASAPPGVPANAPLQSSVLPPGVSPPAQPALANKAQEATDFALAAEEQHNALNLDGDAPKTVAGMRDEQRNLQTDSENMEAAANNFQQAGQALEDPIKTQRAHDEQRAAQSYLTDLENITQAYQTKSKDQMTHYQSAIDDFRETNSNPWPDHSIGWQIGSALFIGLNQLGSSLGGANAPNQAMKMFEQANERALQQMQMQLAQKREGIGDQKNLLDHMRTVFDNDKTALQATRVAGLQMIASQAEQSLAQLAPEKRSMQAQETVARLAASHDQERSKLDQLQVKGMEEDARKAKERAFRATMKRLGQKHEDTEKNYTTMGDAIVRGHQRGPTAKAVDNMQQADKALEFKQLYPNLDDMPAQEWNTFIEEVGKMASGGVLSEAGFHNLDVGTFQKKITDKEQLALNKPVGAGLGKFAREYMRYVEGVKKVNEKLVQKTDHQIFKSHERRLTAEQRERAKVDFDIVDADQK